MNENDKFNFLQEVSMPEWILQDIQNLDQPLFQKQTKKINQYLVCKLDDHSEECFNNGKRKNPVSYQVNYRNLINKNNQKSKNNELSSQSQQQTDQKLYKNNTQKKEDPKRSKKCQTSKKYRQKKRQYVKSLQEENRFLKFKIDELNFRLNQAQLEINRLKNKDNSLSTLNYQSQKEQCFKQLQKLLQKGQTDFNKLFQAHIKLRQVMDFNGKQKIDLLNYFMSQLLENVINDRSFYMMDCFFNKKGIHRPANEQPRKIDLQIFQILQINNPQKQKIMRQTTAKIGQSYGIKFKQLWKKLYQVYLAILNQGFKISTMIQSVKTDMLKMVQPLNLIKMELYFQKIKHRSDMRQIRSSWFRELQNENQLEQIQSLNNPSKRNKTNHNL